MRHKMAGNRLSRNQSLRKATLRDMAKSTLVQERILTTSAKAKEARRMIERLITLGKKGTLAAHRKAFAILCDHQLVSRLFKDIAPMFKSRAGGYTRIIPSSQRRGDNAAMVYLELTEKTKVIISNAKKAAVPKAAEVTDSKEAVTDATVSPVVNPAHAKTAAKQKSPVAPKLKGGIKKMFQRKTGGE